MSQISLGQPLLADEELDGGVTAQALSASLMMVLEVLISHADEPSMITKLKALNNYADTFFDGRDLEKIMAYLSVRPKMMKCLYDSNIKGAAAELQQESSVHENIAYAIDVIDNLYTRLTVDEQAMVWDEVRAWCNWNRQWQKKKV